MGIIEERNQHNKQGRHEEKPHNNQFLHRILHFISFTGLFIWLSYEAHGCLKEYSKKPTYTETHIVQQYHAAFPALSMCTMPNGYKEDIVKVKHF